MNGLWVIWGIVAFLLILSMMLGSRFYVVYAAAGFVILAIMIATSIIVEEIKNVRKD